MRRADDAYYIDLSAGKAVEETNSVVRMCRFSFTYNKRVRCEGEAKKELAERMNEFIVETLK